MLVVPSYAMPFYFGDSLPDDFRVILADPALTQVYVDQWKTQLMGYGSLDEMTANNRPKGNNGHGSCSAVNPSVRLRLRPCRFRWKLPRVKRKTCRNRKSRLRQQVRLPRRQQPHQLQLQRRKNQPLRQTRRRPEPSAAVIRRTAARHRRDSH